MKATSACVFKLLFCIEITTFESTFYTKNSVYIEHDIHNTHLGLRRLYH